MTENNYNTLAVITAYAKTLKELGYTEKEATLVRELVASYCAPDELVEVMSNIHTLEAGYGHYAE